MKTSTILVTAGAALAAAILLWPAAPAPAPPRLPASPAMPVVKREAPPPSAPNPEVPALVQRILTASDPREKGQAADALARIGSHEAVEHLLQLAAAQTDAAHRTAIIESLNNLTNPDGLAALASVLTATRDAEIIAAATATLSRAGNADTLSALVEFYRERNDGPQQKNAVLRAIAGLNSPEVRRPLAKLAHSAPEPALAAAAQEALANSQ